MRYPDFLPEGGTVGFVAPSFGCATEPYTTLFDEAIARFHEMGYKTVEGPNCRADLGIGISNDPKLCGEELNDYYCSSESDVLISCGGGELMCEVIPYMDFDRIRAAKPKWYMGYSDNTNFTFLSATLCDTAAIYGPCAGSFGMKPWDAAISDAFNLLCGRIDRICSYDKWERESLKDEEHPLVPYNLTEETKLRPFIPSNTLSSLASGTVKEPCMTEASGEIHVKGRLIGGCMDCLVNILGTEFDGVKAFTDKYADDGFIWFLESCDLNIMSIRRAIWQMKHAGWFSHVKGFLIGRPLCFGQEMFGIDQYRAVTDLLAEYQVPVIMDMDIGHLPPMMPIVCGAMAEAEYSDGKAAIRYFWE
ncbi:MAG: LD-carboxypeptidase [Clostridiales bacterium]|nr:LD-carboxypeptidase [Clostridiales bacterium]